MKTITLAVLISTAVLSCVATPISPLSTTTSLDIQPSPTNSSDQNRCGPVCIFFAPDATCIKIVDSCTIPPRIASMNTTKDIKQEVDEKASPCGPVCIRFAPDGTCIQIIDGCSDPTIISGVRAIPATTPTKDKRQATHEIGPHVSCIPAPHGCIPILSPPKKEVNESVKPVGPGCNQVCVHFDANGNCDLAGNSCSSDAGKMGMSVMAIVAVGLALFY